MTTSSEPIEQFIVVEGYVATTNDHTDMREAIWSFALDQRTFGPRRLVVAFTDRDGRFLALAHAPRTEPPELALQCCIEYLGAGAAGAVAFHDEQVTEGPPSSEDADRFARAEVVAARYDLRLVDWIACDDQLFRSMRLSRDRHLPWDDL